MKIIIVGTLDFHRGDLANAQRPAGFDMDDAVDLRCIALAAAFGRIPFHFVDYNGLAAADLALETPPRNIALAPALR